MTPYASGSELGYVASEFTWSPGAEMPNDAGLTFSTGTKA